jgi:DNA-binding NarL/FixJ family response regulator
MARAPQGMAAPAPRSPRGAGTNLRFVPDVLLATDADWIHDEVDAVLGDEDTTVVRVRTGREVSAAVQAVEPGLVVLDLQIGNMGGIAAAINLRQEFEGADRPCPPILLLLDRPADVPLARRTDLDGGLVKPIDAFRLRRAARALAAGEPFHEPSGLAAL